MFAYVKKVTGQESFKRAFWSLVIMIFSYLVLNGPNLFPSSGAY